jgi:hypothetical protein
MRNISQSVYLKQVQSILHNTSELNPSCNTDCLDSVHGAGEYLFPVQFLMASDPPDRLDGAWDFITAVSLRYILRSFVPAESARLGVVDRSDFISLLYHF